ncbi:Uncharacterized membrane protein [Ruminococcaceae bacterium KH2T8]|nr:Uncharacterized membrane protein [Ruminococcaceae bacterium KH2T8]
MTLFEVVCFFLIYSFIGWVTEVIYHAVTLGKIMNRGFLNGPVCPVYGFGMTAVLFVFDLTGINDLFLTFIIGVALTTGIELVAGFLLYTFFHARWWDYSNMPLNLGGYICPAFSIIWGLAVVAVVRLAHPAIAALVFTLIPLPVLVILTVTFLIVMIIDTTVTALSLIGLNKKLAELDKISSAMRDASDKLTEKIGKQSIESAQSAQTARVQAALAKAELKDAAKAGKIELERRADEKRDELRRLSEETTADLQRRYNEIRSSLTTHRHYGVGRLLNVFPNVKHRDYKDILDELRTYGKR